MSDDEYWRRCQQLANESLPAGTLRYMGPYQPENSQAIFSESTVFLFPTRGENFGHVVAEALSVGCPVVITPTTPWTKLVLSGAGHLINHTDGAVEYVQNTMRGDPHATESTRARTLQLYKNWFATQSQSSIF